MGSRSVVCRLALLSIATALASACAEADELDPISDSGPLDAAADTASSDAGPADASIADSGDDTSVADTGTPDTALGDTGTPDTGAPDTGTPDTGTPDTGMPDTGMPDTGAPDAGDPCAVALGSLGWDFESGASGWTHAGLDGVSTSWPVDQWEHGTSTSTPPSGGGCHGGTKCWATRLAGNYVQCGRAALRSPDVDLTACSGRTVKVAFWHAYEFSTPTWSGKTYADGGIVEISSNGGGTWIAAPIASLPGTVDINPSMGSSYSCLSSTSFYVDGKQGFVGSSGGWQRVELTIPASHLTSSFRIRFAYSSGVSYQTTSATTSMTHSKPGWYVDDVSFELAE